MNTDYSCPQEYVSKKNFFIGTVDTLFADDDESEFQKLFDDGADELLNNAVDLYERPKGKPSLIPDNMLYCLQYTKKEREEKKFKAMVRLRDTKTANSVKNQLKDLFYPIEEWPVFIIRILIGDVDFNYSSRISMATFFHGNGFLDSNRAEWLIKFYNKQWRNRKGDEKQWTTRFNKFNKLFEYLNKANDPSDVQYHAISSTYYYYNMLAKQTMFYDGWIRGPKGEKLKYSQFHKYQ